MYYEPLDKVRIKSIDWYTKNKNDYYDVGYIVNEV